jgi:hypothetical protein
MKKLLLAWFVVVIAFAAMLGCSRQKHSRSSEDIAIQTAASVPAPLMPTEEPVDTTVTPTPPALPVPPVVAAQPSVAPSHSPLVQPLVSRQTSYAQKQAAWAQLRESGRLDEVITDLERAPKDEPKAAEYRAALGVAYVQKLRTLEDFREQSVLAIKADQTFDQALELDLSNWDARFWKALSLSYWPEGLNKTGEVIDQFVTLVEQQEKQPPQPQFAQTYVLLGEQYQKAGYPDDAKAIWQRGASLFPGNNRLWEKLASAQ